jgi:methionyl-tRNA formyltransferase
MRVALFAAGGEIPLRTLEALAPACEIVGIVRPGRPVGMRGALREALRQVQGRPDAVSAFASRRGIPERRARGAGDPSLAAWLHARGTEMICVATFPWRLRPDVLAVPRLGAANVHASLLPRHRGPNPWFWVYHADDRETGVSVHVCAPEIDMGAVLAQEAWPLQRGYPVAALHADVAQRGARLLAEVVSSAGHNRHTSQPQDPLAATNAPRLTPGVPMIGADWGAERTWHLLAGTVGQYREPLRCGGEPVPYERAPAFEIMPARAAPGTVERVSEREWRLWRVDGCVTLAGGA